MIAYFAIAFAFLFAIALIGFLIYASPGIKKATDIPGPLPTDKEQGNMADIAAAGSLHEFLCQQHELHGEVIGFYYGKQFIVSLASAKLFSQTEGLFDRPTQMYAHLLPLIGHKSIQFANGREGKRRRVEYDRAFSHSNIMASSPILLTCANELINRLTEMSNEAQHVPLMRYCVALAAKATILVTMETDAGRLSDKELSNALNWYNVAWAEMEAAAAGGDAGVVGEEADGRKRAFEESVNRLRQFVETIVRRRRRRLKDGEGEKSVPLLIDRMMELHGDDEEAVKSDAITFMVGGFHTSGTLLAWALYYACTRPDLVERIREEAAAAASEVENDDDKSETASVGLSADSLSRLVFTRRFVDETLRHSCLAPMSMRVNEEEAVDLNGYSVPAGTPLLLSLGASYACPNNFVKPDAFNPDREFELFRPFGWGRRSCPGYRLAYAEVTLWLASLLMKFDFQLADSECQPVPAYGLVTKPRDEIWVTVSPARN